MFPAYQRLCAGQPLIPDPVFGLQVNQELLLFQGRFHTVDNGLLPQQFITQLVVIGGKILSVLSLDAARRKEGAVGHLLYRNAAVFNGKNPPFHHNVFRIGEGVNHFIGPDKHIILIFIPVFQQAGKLIRAQAAACPSLAREPTVQFSNSAQQLVTRSYAENVVNQFKIFNVRAQDIVLLPRILIKDFPYALVKELLAVKAGQPVILKLVNHRRRFPEVDDACHPVPDDLGLVRFCHKIGRPVGQSRNLVGLAVTLGRNDYRNRCKNRICFCNRKECISIHNRHRNIKQDQ